MKQLGLIKFAAGATLLLAALSPRAVRADSWDRKTTINFSDTVQIPGTTLPAGTYVFKLWDSQSDRYVVQIFNERQNHVFATLLTIPDHRMTAPDKTVVSFYEAPAGQPQPIKAWFYPGDNNGREFVYSKAEADVISKAAHENVPSETVAVAQNTPTFAPQPAVASQTETDQSVEEDAQAATPAPAPVAAEPEPKQESPMVDEENAEDQQPTAEPAAQDPPATPAAPTDSSSMPSTGSELPLAALIGLTSIGAAVSVRALRYARRNEVG